MTRSEIVAEAREWLGTPFVHQGRRKLIGGDCVAMVEEIALNHGVVPSRGRTNYGREPMSREILETLRRYFERLPSIDDRLPGDVAFMAFTRQPQHLGIIAPEGRIIHGYSLAGKYVETNLNTNLLDGLRSVWRFPGVTN